MRGPAAVRGPGIPHGVCDSPVSLVSLCSTLTALANVPLIASNDGEPLTPWINHSETTRSYGPVFPEYDLGGAEPKYMVGQRDWKYTYWLHDIPELYNLRTDPSELHNLAALPRYAAEVEAMRRTLFAWHKPDRS